MYRSLFICIVFVTSIKADYDRAEGTECVSSDGHNGTCQNIHICPVAISRIHTDYKLETCSFEGDDPVICCTQCPNELLPRSSIPKPKPSPNIGDKARQHCQRHFLAYNFKCVTHTTYTEEVIYNEKRKCDHISAQGAAPVGGYDTDRAKNPHMVLLGYGTNMDAALWLCAGSTISPRFILTAAHCTYDTRLGPVKFMATNMTSRSDPLKIWDRYNVKKIYNHPEYHAPIKYHDIALLEIDRKIQMSFFSLPACLPYNDVNDTLAYATGWGSNTTKGPLYDTLQRVDLEKFTDKECSTLYPVHRNLPFGYDKTTQMCYGHHSEIKDTCPGDSGGPLQVTHFEKNCAITIIGVTSYGKQCGSVGEPGMYTRVAPYLHWIEGIVWPGYVGWPRVGVHD